MWNHCGQVSPAYDYCGPTYSMPAYDMCGGDGGYKGSYFVLIVVLFILLIIVGKCYM
ncbi:YjcZ family sporulation protein [Ureibacillus sinduriensis]|uniref:YjcZ family sporulation protein n=1 Tax=Ureibacillus sinduriensis TaxID=561440 RepID=UPI000A049B42|nr:YjcZ family sporulation protein [Ureibacillus sinduriensis]